MPPAFRQSVARNRTVFTKRAAAAFSESGPARFACLACPSRLHPLPAIKLTILPRFACPFVYRKSKRLAATAASQRRMIARVFVGRLAAAARLLARFTFLLVGRHVAAAAPTAAARLPARFTFSLLAACPPVTVAARRAPRGELAVLRVWE